MDEHEGQWKRGPGPQHYLLFRTDKELELLMIEPSLDELVRRIVESLKLSPESADRLRRACGALRPSIVPGEDYDEIIAGRAFDKEGDSFSQLSLDAWVPSQRYALSINLCACSGTSSSLHFAPLSPIGPAARRD